MQRNGRILAVAHGDYIRDRSTQIITGGLNTIFLYDKLTGASLGSMSVPNPQRMTFDGEGKSLGDCGWNGIPDQIRGQSERYSADNRPAKNLLPWQLILVRMI